MIIDFSNKDLYNYKFIPLLINKKRYIFMMGGGGSGKSKFQAQKEIIKSFIKGNRLLGVRKVKESIKDSMFTELEKVIYDWKIQDYFIITKSPLYIKNKLTNSDFIFRGLDDVEKIKSVSKVTRIWIEEATEIRQEDFDQLDIRLRGVNKELQITCTYNPISDKHWLITNFWNYGNTEDIECFHSTFLDNRFVGYEHYGKMLERLKETDINMYNIYALGIPGQALEGLIYSYNSIDKVPEEARFLGYGLDFGYNHPAVMIGLYEWNDGVILDEVFFKSGMINKDIVDFCLENGIDKRAEIIADNARPEAIEEIRRGGFNCKPCEKGKDSVATGISTVKKLKLYITRKSVKTMKDFDNYVRAKNKATGENEEFPVKMFDDSCDSARYIITHFYGIRKTKTYITG